MSQTLSTLSKANLSGLRVFLTVVEKGGFSQAQRELNMSAAAISTYMSNLETRLGARLCTRGRQGFGLTKEGQATLSAIRKLLMSLDAFENETDFSRHAIKGELRIVSVDNIVSNIDCPLVSYLQEFGKQYPGVNQRLDILAPGALEQSVLSGEYHFGIGSFYQRSDRLAYKPLFNEDQCLYCSMDHPLYEKPSMEVTARDIKSKEYVARGYMAKMEEDLLPESIPAAISHHVEGVALLILTGKYFGYLPKHVADRWVWRSKLKPLLERTLSYSSPFYLVYPKIGQDDPIRQAFLRKVDEYES